MVDTWLSILQRDRNSVLWNPWCTPDDDVECIETCRVKECNSNVIVLYYIINIVHSLVF
jgi:hypothetical protein